MTPTADDLFMIQSFINNGQIDRAADLICELKYGMTASEFEQSLHKEMVAVIIGIGKLFQDRHPEFYPCKENEQIMLKWMLNRNLDGMRIESFEMAYENVKDILVGRPEVDKPKPAPQPKKQPWEKYTQKEIDAMRGDEYYQKVVLPEFKAKQQPDAPVETLGINTREPEESAEQYRLRVVVPEFKAARQSR